MKMCNATFPIKFWNEKKDEIIENYFNPYNVNEEKQCVDISFEIDNETDLKDYIYKMMNEYADVPMFFWQEEDVGGYDYSQGQDIYVLPNNKTVVVSWGDSYNTVKLSTLKKVKTIDELKKIIEEVEKRNPIPPIDKYFREYNA